MIDLLSILALAGFSFLGWKRGAKAMALWALSLVAGSVAGALLARPVGLWVAAKADLPALVAVPLAGFAAAGLFAGIVRSAARRAQRARLFLLDSGWEPPTWDRWVGTTVGALCGAGVALFAAWVGNATGSFHGHEAELRASVVGRAAAYLGEPVIRLLAGGAVDNTVMAAAAAYLMSDPQRARETLGALAGDSRVRELALDPDVRAELAGGQGGALSRTPALRALAADPGFVTAARRVRILPEGPGPTVTPQELAASAAERLGPLAKVADILADDPDVRILLADQDFKDALARGDLAGLLAQGTLDRIAQRAAAELERLR